MSDLMLGDLFSHLRTATRWSAVVISRSEGYTLVTVKLVPDNPKNEIEKEREKSNEKG